MISNATITSCAPVLSSAQCCCLPMLLTCLTPLVCSPPPFSSAPVCLLYLSCFERPVSTATPSHSIPLPKPALLHISHLLIAIPWSPHSPGCHTSPGLSSSPSKCSHQFPLKPLLLTTTSVPACLSWGPTQTLIKTSLHHFLTSICRASKDQYFSNQF